MTLTTDTFGRLVCTCGQIAVIVKGRDAAGRLVENVGPLVGGVPLAILCTNCTNSWASCRCDGQARTARAAWH